MNKMRLIKHKCEPHRGYGAGTGTVDTYIYVCPCGKGTVEYIEDNIPGFRDKEIWIHCDVCWEKYGFVKSLSELEGKSD